MCRRLNSTAMSKGTFFCYFLFILFFLVGSQEKSVDIPSLWLAVQRVQLIVRKSAIWELFYMLVQKGPEIQPAGSCAVEEEGKFQQLWWTGIYLAWVSKDFKMLCMVILQEQSWN